MHGASQAALAKLTKLQALDIEAVSIPAVPPEDPTVEDLSFVSTLTVSVDNGFEV